MAMLLHGRGVHKDKCKDRDGGKDKYKTLQRPNVCFILVPVSNHDQCFYPMVIFYLVFMQNFKANKDASHYYASYDLLKVKIDWPGTITIFKLLFIDKKA